MKKILYFLMIGAMAFGMASCSKSDDDNGGNGSIVTPGGDDDGVIDFDASKFECLQGSDYYLFVLSASAEATIADKVVADYRTDGYNTFLYIWENTYTPGETSGPNMFGLIEGWPCLTVAAGWSGCGFCCYNKEELDKLPGIIEDPENYYLHLAMKSQDDTVHTINFYSGNPDEAFGVKIGGSYNSGEPTGEANMTPTRASELWPNLVAVAEKLGMRLTSPAMNYGTLAGYSDPEVWIDEFYSKPGVSLDDVDATAAHCYMPSGEALKSFIRKFYKYGKPVYMTEFCHAQGSITNNVQSQMKFMCDALNYLENDDMVGGYSWFKERGGNTWSAISLLNINASNPELTDLGKVYVNFSTFDKTVYYAIGEAIPAEHYCNNSLAASANTDTWETAPHVKPTTDVTGILELCDFYAVGNWVEYQIDVANSGDYEMLLRYANPIDGQFTLDIDGAETPISLPKTGDETTWRTASVPETAIRRERLNRLFSRSRFVHMRSFLSEILLRTHQLNTCVPPQIARITLVIGIVPMLGHTEAPDRRTVAFGVIDRARRRIAGLCCLRKVHVGVIYIGHVGKFVGQEIDTDHVDGHRILAGKERTGPIAAERLHLPLRSGLAADIAAPVQAVDKVEHALAAQILMAHEIDECYIFSRTVTALVEVVVEVLAPVGVYAHRAVPVLAAQGDTLTYMPLQQSHVYNVVGLGECRRNAAGLTYGRKRLKGLLHGQFRPYLGL